MRPLAAMRRVPEPDDFYDDAGQAAHFSDHAARWPLAWFGRAFLKKILHRLDGRAVFDVLDVGAGPGHIAIALKNQKPEWRMTILDASNAMLDIARGNATAAGVSLNFTPGYIGRSPFSSDAFDLIYSHFAFHEFDDPAAALSDMKRLTRRGGWIAVQDMVRPPGFLLPLVALAAPVYSRDLRMQLRSSLRACYTVQEIRDLARGAGFAEESLAISTFGFPFQVFTLFIRC